jgi:putative copper export protein
MAAASLLGILGRWLLFSGTVLWIGAVGTRWVLLPVWARHPVPAEPLRGRLMAAASTLGVFGGLLLVTGTLARLQMQAVDFVDPFDPPGPQVRLLVTSTFWGRVWLVQAATVAVGLLAFVASRGGGGRSAWSVAGAAALVAGIVPSLSGHAIATEDLAGLAVLADSAHVLAAGLWLGVLSVVILAIARSRKDWTDPGFRSQLAQMLAIFSPMALGCAAILAGTGLFGSWLHLESPAALLEAAYGRALLWKLVAVAGVAGAGAYNWRRLKPRISEASSPEAQLKSALVETTLASAVLLLTGVLVVTSPN